MVKIFNEIPKSITGVRCIKLCAVKSLKELKAIRHDGRVNRKNRVRKVRSG